MEDHFEYCAALVRESNRDRYLATLFAPAEKRDALFALYAFDVEVSRVRDLAREPMPGEIRLQWWREMLLGERGSEVAGHPVAAAVMEGLAQQSLSSDLLVDLLEAHRFDLYDEPMSDLDALRSYASRTAGAIVELSAAILAGNLDPATTEFFAAAGDAQTFASILSLLPRHAARRQLYIPLEMLRQHQVHAEDIFAMHVTPELRAILAELRLRARRSLAVVGAAGEGIPVIARPAFLALAPLRQWLLDMERLDYDPFRPPQIPPWRSQWRIWRAAKSFRRIGA
ncbi:MAG TPA: phytoene/squalene synthase family protein [Pseudolabrys sp.]|nr:phytoene/squalene synthase family protein [Pseudolabrys sp.]